MQWIWDSDFGELTVNLAKFWPGLRAQKKPLGGGREGIMNLSDDIKRREYVSPRVQEVVELRDLLTKNHLIEHFALRIAIECVYGLKDDFYRHNDYINISAIQKAEDTCWNAAHNEKIKRGEG